MMQHLRRKILLELYKLADLVIMVCVLAFCMIFFSELPKEEIQSLFAFFSVKIKLVNVILLGMIVAVWRGIFSTFGLYRSRFTFKVGDEFLNIWKAVGIGTMLIATLSFFFDRQNITISILVSFWLICSSAIFLSRFLIRKFLFQVRKHGRNLRHIIVIGSGKRGQALAAFLTKREELGYKLLGFVDDKVEANGVTQAHALLCKLDELPEFLGKTVVDEVFITLPMKSYYNKISEVMEACEQQGIPVHMPLNFFSTGISKTKPVLLEGMPFVVRYTGRDLDLKAMFLKRTIDIIFSSILIVLFLPVFSVIALIIKLTSSGPVLFFQKRVGYNKRVFRLLKFRTMVKDAEVLQAEYEHLNEVDGPIFKIKDDPRTTKVGKFLRKTSLDELPQLFNVLMGDMSLVGPRPLPIRDVNLFEAHWHKRRFSVRPGMTGLWQINGRNKAEFDKLIKYDLEYIDNWSPWLDMNIMLKTVPAVMEGDGAM
ncbi:sugar transferase [candidate division KSB1 bacterium]|nr:sugar transferase [candidate division KSB1 bacterium]